MSRCLLCCKNTAGTYWQGCLHVSKSDLFMVEDLSQKPIVWLVLENRLIGVARAESCRGAPQTHSLLEPVSVSCTEPLNWGGIFGKSNYFVLRSYGSALCEISCVFLRQSFSIREGTLLFRAFGGLKNLAPFWPPLASFLVTRVLGTASFAVIARVLLLVCISISI